MWTFPLLQDMILLGTILAFWEGDRDSKTLASGEPSEPVVYLELAALSCT